MKEPIRITLTEEQRRQIREATGRDVKAIELMPEDLERLANPGPVPQHTEEQHEEQEPTPGTGKPEEDKRLPPRRKGK